MEDLLDYNWPNQKVDVVVSDDGNEFKGVFQTLLNDNEIDRVIRNPSVTDYI